MSSDLSEKCTLGSCKITCTLCEAKWGFLFMETLGVLNYSHVAVPSGYSAVSIMTGNVLSMPVTLRKVMSAHGSRFWRWHIILQDIHMCGIKNMENVAFPIFVLAFPIFSQSLAILALQLGVQKSFVSLRKCQRPYHL